MNLLNKLLTVSCWLVAISAAAFAQDKPAADPLLPPPVRFQVLLTQRDFLLAKADYEEKLKRMQQATAEAGSACDKAGKVFSTDALACVDKPNASPAPTAPPAK